MDMFCSNMPRKVIFISPPQFGYQIDYYKYCKYLNTSKQILYICFDFEKEKIFSNKVQVLYSKIVKCRILSNIKYLLRVVRELKKEDNYVCIVYYFRLSFIIPLLLNSKKNKIVLDIRSIGEYKNSVLKQVNKSIIMVESFFYKYITLITEEHIKYIYKKRRNIFIIPLGGEKTDIVPNLNSKKVRLLYVGTINNRNIYQTVKGLWHFIKMHQDLDIKYNIIGDGSIDEINKLRYEIVKYNLGEIVNYLGYIKNELLVKYYSESNIGISYIPITDYYNDQPPTKTFEYLQAGLPTLATDTAANRKIINNTNGELIHDNYLEFSKGLQKILEKLPYYDYFVIKESVKAFTWEIVTKKLEKYLVTS